LSRPACAKAPSVAPSRSPGLAAAGTAGPLRSPIAAARSINRATSTPISAAGTSPKNDSAEKRPPMRGSLTNVRRKPRSAASFCSGVPGSVIATKCAPARGLSRSSSARKNR